VVTIGIDRCKHEPSIIAPKAVARIVGVARTTTNPDPCCGRHSQEFIHARLWTVGE